MRKAGFIIVSIAVESGSDYIRNEIMGKRVSKEQIINVFDWCKQAGILANSFFIVGMPEDTAETLGETADLIARIATNRAKLHQVSPLPGTRLYDQCERDGLFASPKFRIDWRGDRSERRSSSYYGISSNTQKREFRIKPYHLTIEELQEADMQLQQIIFEEQNGQ